MAPCGVSPSVCYTPTGAVTSFIAGQEMTVSWLENTPSAGWFRITLSTQNRTDLSDPAVSVDDAGLSVDAQVAPADDPDAAPLGITTLSYPILADGLFPHVAADIADVPYMYSWTLFLPPNVTCDQCTIQVIEFLADSSDNLPNGNPAGYFAHHCADIQILRADDGGLTTLGFGGSLLLPDDAGGPSTACEAPEAGAAGQDGGVSGGDDAASAGPMGGDADSIVDATTATTSDSAAPEAGDDEAGAAPADSAGTGGCGCVISGADRASPLAGLGILGAVAMSRRGRSTRRAARGSR
jgi:hypothetical protein